MNTFLFVLYIVISLAIFVGLVFLERLLTQKRTILGLILPLLSAINSIIVDVDIISMIYQSFLGPRVTEQYKNGLLLSRSTVVTHMVNIPANIFILAYFNILTILLLIVFFAERKKARREKELYKMKIDDLE